MSEVPLTPLDPPQPRPFFSRWQLALIGLTALAAMLGVAWFVARVKNLIPARLARAASLRHEDPPDEVVKPRPDGGPTQPPNDDPNRSGREAADRLSRALGTVTTIGIRQAHLNVGLLADGVENEVYTVPAAVKTLDQVLTDLATVDRQLEQLSEKVFDEEDREAVTLARKALRLLREQAKDLRTYWETDSKLAAEQYQQSREASLEAIEELLGNK